MFSVVTHGRAALMEDFMDLSLSRFMIGTGQGRGARERGGGGGSASLGVGIDKQTSPATKEHFKQSDTNTKNSFYSTLPAEIGREVNTCGLSHSNDNVMWIDKDGDKSKGKLSGICV